MRVVVAFALLLAGCASPEAPETATGCEADRCDERFDGPSPSNATAGVPAPDLPLGRAWTYDLYSLYDTETEVTIVVAAKDDEGYLFAGAAEDDLTGEVAWDRPWFGRQTTELTDADRWFVLFDFPLEDGKTWDLREGLPVTARAADVRTPEGTEAGFVVEGTGTSPHSGNALAARVTYAPSVGNFVDFEYRVRDAPLYELRLTGTSETATYVWYERGPELDAYWSTPPTDAAKTLDVPEGHDAVVLTAGGAGGGRGVVVPPAGSGASAWQGEFPGEETWTSAVYEAAPGTWSAAANAPQEAWSYVGLRAVTWVRGDVAPAS